MRNYTIEIDEVIMEYLKKNAEPFSDTPNTVLHRLLFGNTRQPSQSQKFQSIAKEGMPKALSQILDVIKLVVEEGKSRPEATRIVADRNNTAPQTVIDKYCRQLGKTAQEVDRLLAEPGFGGFKMLLTQKFPKHRMEISVFFRGLQNSSPLPSPKGRSQDGDEAIKSIDHGKRTLASDRKPRDPVLEAKLKTALGRQLRKEFGDFQSEGQSLLVFDRARVLCKYSSFHNEQSRWFWGVAKTYWQNWENSDHLALIFEDEIGGKYSYLLLDSIEAKKLFSRCSESNGEKKINMRIYMDDKVIRLPEWKAFDVHGRKQPLQLA